MKIHIELPVREQTCPHCKAKTTKIKDYRTQIIKDIPIRFKTTLLSYRKRRYQCKECGKTLEVPYSNGSIEGYHNKIKTLKRVAFGFRNFTNFKARILLMAN